MTRISHPLRTVWWVAPVIAISALANPAIKEEAHTLIPAMVQGGQLDSPLTCVVDPYTTPCYTGTIPCGAFHCDLNNAVSVLHFSLVEDCCDWQIGTCSEYNTDTWLVLDGPGDLFIEGSDDPEICPIECSQYFPDVIDGESTEVACLPAGDYALYVYGYESFAYDPESRTHGGDDDGPQGCEEILQHLPYTVCFDFCQGGGNVVSAGERPQSPELVSVYPNPFNPAATIRWSQPETGAARLTVHDLSGARVATLVDGLENSGEHEAAFDGSGLASGVYFVRLETAGGVSGARMVLAK